MKKLFLLMLMSLSMFDVAWGQTGFTGPNNPLKDLSETLKAEGNCQIFRDLLEAAGQGFPIGLLGPPVAKTSIVDVPLSFHTILVPTDAAFAKVPGDAIEKLKRDPSRLRQFLLTYIIPRKLMIADMLAPVESSPPKTLLEAVNVNGDKVSFLCDAHSGEHHPRINITSSNGQAAIPFTVKSTELAIIGRGDILFAGGVVHEIDQLLHINPFQ